MSARTRFIIIPFKKGKGNGLVRSEQREARNAEAAERLAGNMSARFAGVAAYQMDIDEETGEMFNARLLVRHGEVVDFLEDA